MLLTVVFLVATSLGHPALETKEVTKPIKPVPKSADWKVTLADIKRNLQPQQQKEIEVVKVVEAPKPKPIMTNMEIHTPSEYETMLASFPTVTELLEPDPVVDIASEFVHHVLFREKVQRMRLDVWHRHPAQPGDVAAYIWTSPNNEAAFIQYGTICTKYGNIHVTCELNEDGVLPESNVPVRVYFDSPAMRVALSNIAQEHPERFPKGHAYNPDLVTTIHDINFLFGDSNNNNVSQYF